MKLIKRIKHKITPFTPNICHGRVHAYWTGDSVVSSLSIKSAITEDTGNYSCILPQTGQKVTASLIILKGDQNSCMVSINNMQSERHTVWFWSKKTIGSETYSNVFLLVFL